MPKNRFKQIECPQCGEILLVETEDNKYAEYVCDCGFEGKLEDYERNKNNIDIGKFKEDMSILGEAFGIENAKEKVENFVNLAKEDKLDEWEEE